MSDFIFAIIGLIIGGAVGVLVMSMLTVSKRADKDAEESFDLYVKRKYGSDGVYRVTDIDPKIQKDLTESLKSSPEVFLEAVRHFNQLQNRLIIWECPHCKGVSTLKLYLEARRCPYCGSIGGGEGI